MKTASILTIGCAAMALSITSCTNFGSPNTYNLNEIGGAQETYTGTVTSVENVKIQANNANTILGGIAGNQIDKAVNNTTGERITVRLDQKRNGTRNYTVVQVASRNNPIQVGQRVRVIIGNNGSRVLAY